MRHSRSKVEWPKGIFCIHRARVENLSFLSFPKPLIKLYFQRSFVRSFVRSLVVHSSRKWCHCVCVCVCVCEKYTFDRRIEEAFRHSTFIGYVCDCVAVCLIFLKLKKKKSCLFPEEDNKMKEKVR